jgi:hypothetical protein
MEEGQARTDGSEGGKRGGQGINLQGGGEGGGLGG